MIWGAFILFLLVFLFMKANIGEAILLSIFSVSLEIFLCYCIGVNDYAILICIATAIILLYFMIKKNNNSNIRNIYRNFMGKESIRLLLVLLCLLCMDIITVRHFRPLYDAEFNYYVSSIKYFFETNSFGTNETVMFGGFGSYTPINSLIISVIMKAHGKWNEGIIYIANLFICQLCFVKILTGSKSGLRLLIVFTLPFILLEAFFQGITPECMETACFFWCLSAMWDNKCDDIIGKIKIIIGLAILILVKSPAILMVIVCYLILFMLNLSKRSIVCTFLH